MYKNISLIVVFLVCSGMTIYLVGRWSNGKSGNNFPAISTNTHGPTTARTPRDDSQRNNTSDTSGASSNADDVEIKPIELANQAIVAPVKMPSYTGPPRVGMVLSSRVVQNSDAALEGFLLWLEASLTNYTTDRGEIQWVDRQHLSEVLDEQALSLALDLSSSPSTLRNTLSILDAERLIFIRAIEQDVVDQPEGDTERQVLATVVDSATGLRLHSQAVTLSAHEGSGFDAIASELVTAVAKPISATTLLAVSPVSDARLLATDNKFGRYLQDQIAEAMARPDRLQLEMSEAQALSTEIAIRGDRRLSTTWQPWYIFLRLSDHPDQGKLRARGVLQHGGQIVKDWTADGDANDTSWIVEQLKENFDPIVASGDVTPQDHTTLVAELLARAEQLQGTAQTAEALELIETAILYEPENDSLRSEALQLLTELMKRTADQYTDSLTRQNRQLLREAAPQIHAWHERGLEHVWHLVLKMVDTERGIDREHARALNFTRVHQSIATMFDDVRQHWYEVDSVINLPMMNRVETLRRRMLSLVDRIGPQGENGSLTYTLFYYTWPDTVRMHESNDLIQYRFETIFKHVCKLPELDQIKDPTIRASIAKNQYPEQYIAGLDRALDVVDQPIVLHRAELLRVSWANKIDRWDMGGRKYKTTADGWPPGFEPTASLTAKAGADVPQILDPEEAFAQWINPSALPKIQPRSIIKAPSMFGEIKPRFTAGCGRWGDLIWSDYGVYLLTSEGTIRNLILRHEMPERGTHWVRNVSFDGRHIWVLLPGPSTRVLIIDPATGTRREFNADAGLPPTDTGGSVMAVGEGIGIAFGSFGSDSTVRTWYAKLTLDGDQLKTEILRSDKSRSTADSQNRNEGEGELRAYHTGQLALCQDPDNAQRRIVIGELCHWVLKASNRSSNMGASFARIDPKNGSVLPGYLYSKHINAKSRGWIPLTNGQILSTEYGHHLMYDPFDDEESMVRGKTRMDHFVDTPIGQFMLEEDQIAGERVALLCYAASEREPFRPIATISKKKYVRLNGWSPHHGLLLRCDSHIASISDDTINSLPEPTLDFSQIGDFAYRRFFDHELKDAGDWRFALLFTSPSGPGKPHPGWTLAQAKELAKAYNTTLPKSIEQIRAQRKAKKHGMFPQYWTGGRTLKTSGSINIETDLLPEGSTQGNPVFIDSRGRLLPASPDQVCFVMLPFPIQGKSEPSETSSEDTLAVPSVVEIPAGTAIIGSKPDLRPLALVEKQRSVTVPPGLFMMPTELSIYHYQQLMSTSTEKVDIEKIRNSAWQPQQLSATDAKSYIERLREVTGENWRFPTEAEWEYACRAGTTTRFASGDEEASLRRMASCIFDDVVKPNPPQFIAEHEPNAWGLYDMHGGLSEYAASSPLPDPIYTYFTEHKKYPTSFLMSRGGNFLDDPSHCRSASRRMCHQWRMGLRLVLDRSGQPPTE